MWREALPLRLCLPGASLEDKQPGIPEEALGKCIHIKSVSQRWLCVMGYTWNHWKRNQTPTVMPEVHLRHQACRKLASYAPQNAPACLPHCSLVLGSLCSPNISLQEKQITVEGYNRWKGGAHIVPLCLQGPDRY